MDNEVTIKIGSKRKPHSYPPRNTERWDAKTSSDNLDSVQKLYSKTQLDNVSNKKSCNPYMLNGM